MFSSFFYENLRERRRILANTREIIRHLAVDIGERTLQNYETLDRARKFIREYFIRHGQTPREEAFIVDGKETANIIAEIPGFDQPESIIIVGAHYDTIEGSPGADDNASAIATMLELSRLLSRFTFKRTVRFVAFTLEEPPYFSTESMGSWVHAKGCRARGEQVDLMICLEMLGYGGRWCKQAYPLDIIKGDIPPRGDFLLVASLPSSSQHTFLWKKLYNAHATRQIIELIGPASIPGISHSDHYSFWKHGIPGIMLTDTAFYRNKNYHTPDDTYDTINFRFLSQNIMDCFMALRDLLNKDTLFDF
ncbi:MAG: M28 family peptidase [Spirochaetes bacterium]|nr:M28 family peptidase [Spirochaetota bacterium]